MGAKSRREETEDRITAFKLRMKKKASEPTLEVSEKGRYFSLLYDKQNGRFFTKDREELFQKLHKKYGKQ